MPQKSLIKYESIQLKGKTKWINIKDDLNPATESSKCKDTLWYVYHICTTQEKYNQEIGRQHFTRAIINT